MILYLFYKYIKKYRNMYYIKISIGNKKVFINLFFIFKVMNDLNQDSLQIDKKFRLYLPSIVFTLYSSI